MPHERLLRNVHSSSGKDGHLGGITMLDYNPGAGGGTSLKMTYLANSNQVLLTAFCASVHWLIDGSASSHLCNKDHDQFKVFFSMRTKF